MSRKSIDERIVRMEFDNSNFEKNVAQSLGTIEKLSSAISDKLDTTNFNLVSAAAETTGKGFSALANIGIGAFRKLGGEVETWGVNMVKSLTGVTNIQQGYAKFDDLTNNVAQLVSQGYELADVEKSVGNINWFSDETSYRAPEMIKLMTSMTAQGKSLEVAEKAAKGIALWTAKSGVTASEAGRTWVQLAQAISHPMTAQDWSSVMTGGMDTAEFKKMAMETAVEMGKLEKSADGMYKSLIGKTDWFDAAGFRDSLAPGKWFDTDVQIATYEKYAAAVDKIQAYTEEHNVTSGQAIEALGDELDEFAVKAFRAGQETRTWGDLVDATQDAVSSGWSNVIQQIIGNYEEAKDFFSELVEVFYDWFVIPVQGLGNFMQEWHDLGGRDSFISGLLNLFYALTNVIYTVRDAFSELFPHITAERLVEITQQFEEWTEGVNEASESMDGLRGTIRGIVSILSILWQAVSGLVRAVFPILKPLAEIFGVIVEIISAILGLNEGISNATKESDAFFKVFSAILWPVKTVLEFIASGMKSVSKWFKEVGGELVSSKFTELWTRAQKVFSDLTTSASELFTQMTGKTPEEVFANIQKKAEGAVETVKQFFGISDWDSFGKNVLDKYNRSVERLAEFIEDFFSKGNFLVSYFEGGEGASGILEVIFDKIADLTRLLFDLFGIWTGLDVDETKENVVSWIQKARDVVVDFTYALQQSFGKAIAWFKSLGKESEDTEKKLDWSSISAFFTSLWATVQKVGTWISNLAKKVWAAIEPYFIKVKEAIANADFEGLLNILKGAGAALGGYGIFTLFKKIKDMIDGPDSITEKLGSFVESIQGPFDALTNVLNGFATDLLVEDIKKVAIAIAIFAGAMFVLSMIDAHALGLVAGVLMYLIAEVTAAIVIIKKLTKEDDDTDVLTKRISKSIKSLTNTFNRNKTISTIGTTLVKAALAILVLAAALKVISSIPAGDLERSVGAIVKLLVAVGLMTAMLTRVSDSNEFDAARIKAVGTVLIKIGIAIMVLVGALFLISKIPAHDLKRSMTALTMLLIAIAGAILLLSSIDSDTSFVAVESIGKALIEISVAIIVIALALKMMAKLNPSELKRSMLAMIGIMAMLSLMIMSLQVGSKDIGIKTGVAILAAAAAILILTTALERLAKIDIVSLVTAGLTLGVLFGAIAIALGYLADKDADMLSVGAGLLMVSLAMAVLGKVLETFAAIDPGPLWISIGALAAIIALFTAAGVIISKTGAVEGLIALAATFISFGAGLALTGLGLVLIGKGLVFLSVGITAIMGVIGLFVAGFVKGFGLLLDGLTTLIPKIVSFAVSLVVEFVNGLISNIPQISEAGFNMIKALLDSLLANDRLKDLVDTGLKVLNAFLEGIAENIQDITDTCVDIIVGFINGISENMGDILDCAANLLINFLNGLADAVDNHAQEIMDAADHLITSLVRAIVLCLSLGEVDLYDASEDLAENGIFGSLKDWIKEKAFEIWGKAREIVDKLISGIKSKWEDFKNSVKHLADGFVEGIKEFFTPSYAKMQGVAGKQLAAFESVYEIGSPSKKMKWEAKMVIGGFVGGLKTYGDAAVKASKSVGENTLKGFTSAIKHINDSLDGSMDYDPVIRPILDLTDLENGVSKANGLFNNNRPMFSGTVTRNLNAISDTQTMPEGTNVPTTGTINFTQNNYSPKALSSVEIYRQTRNQLSVMKGRVGAR